jgi:hypothetical protein
MVGLKLIQNNWGQLFYIYESSGRMATNEPGGLAIELRLLMEKLT